MKKEMNMDNFLTAIESALPMDILISIAEIHEYHWNKKCLKEHKKGYVSVVQDMNNLFASFTLMPWDEPDEDYEFSSADYLRDIREHKRDYWEAIHGHEEVIDPRYTENEN